MGATTELRPFTEQDREILEFERRVWRYAGAKETEVRSRFGINYTRYHQVLDYLLDHPEAEGYDAVTVRRLRRLRDQRAAQRSLRLRQSVTSGSSSSSSL